MAYSVWLLGGFGLADGGASFVAALEPNFKGESYALAKQAFDRFPGGKPDIILLDLDLPDMPGLTFLQALRQMEGGKDLPVIAVSPKRTEESVAQAFGLGVDDYIVRPIDVREVRARLQAVVRRRYERVEHWGAALSVGKVAIDPSQRRCVVGGKSVYLQPREFELLEILMRNAGRVLRRTYLLETIWGMSKEANTRAVDVMISRLRRRLGKEGERIETISKLGYLFVSPESRIGV